VDILRCGLPGSRWTVLRSVLIHSAPLLHTLTQIYLSYVDLQTFTLSPGPRQIRVAHSDSGLSLAVSALHTHSECGTKPSAL
jgi:hypothetical protein